MYYEYNQEGELILRGELLRRRSYGASCCAIMLGLLSAIRTDHVTFCASHAHKVRNDRRGSHVTGFAVHIGSAGSVRVFSTDHSWVTFQNASSDISPDVDVTFRLSDVSKLVCRSCLLSGRNVRWPCRMLPPGESQ